MSVSVSAIEAIAPDQASLKAASKLLSPAKWPEREVSSDGALIWGACQGSGANPYRVVVDTSDLGAKCSCPSRKFPCKHALALMMQYAERPGDFTGGEVPQWITDWLGRRRKGTAAPAQSNEGKSLAAAKLAEAEKPADPKAEARKAAAAAKRAEATKAAIADGLAELEAWIADQLRTGLTELLGDMTTRCRRIAARLVDAKAGTLAGRIDGIPARVLALPQPARPDALIAELGKLVLIIRAWGNGRSLDPALRRVISGAENREILLEDKTAIHHSGRWEVLASRDEATRDGLIARSTWLLGLVSEAPRFALLQDFFPANLGKQGAAFVAGEQFEAELVFYPGPNPLRAQVLTRTGVTDHQDWPEWPGAKDTIAPFAEVLAAEPWLTEWPVLLKGGYFAKSGDRLWWSDSDVGLPFAGPVADSTILGAPLRQTVALWNGQAADLLASDTSLGRFHPDA